jgi:hypothetical protein
MVARNRPHVLCSHKTGIKVSLKKRVPRHGGTPAARVVGLSGAGVFTCGSHPDAYRLTDNELREKYTEPRRSPAETGAAQ